MPARIVFPVSRNEYSGGPISQRGQALEGLLHLLLATNYSNELLHHFLERVLNLVRAFRRRACRVATEWLERVCRCLVYCIRRYVSRRGIRCELRGMLAGELSEHEKIRE